MGILDFLTEKKNNLFETYVGIFLKETEGTVFFIRTDSLSRRVLAKERFVYSNDWDNIVEDIDQAIYKLESETKQSPQKAIFFIYSHLVDAKRKEIKSIYLDKIKKIVKGLELVPLGYIECHEAVVEYLAKKEETPVTSLLIEFDKTNLDLFAYRAGKLIFAENILRTDNLIEDLLPSFQKIKSQYVIPSRMILYDSSDLDIEASKLTSHRWKEDFFIQMPKVHVIHEEELTEALLDTFISQILSTKKIELGESIDDKEEGNKDEVMGFVIGADASPPPEQSTTSTPVPSNFKNYKFPGLNLKSILDKILGLFQNIKIPNLSFARPMLPLLGIGVIVISLFFLEFFLHKAEVIVELPSKKISKNILVSDLKIKIATETPNFSDSKETTGKREIGEHAKGSVTVYNSSLNEGKNLSKGTVLSSPSSIKFLLDNDLKIASATGDASSIISSTAKGSATAKDIGPDSNLSSGVKFTIEGQSPSFIIAKNDTAFSGGSKKEVKTVAKQDIEELKNRIIKKGKDYTKKELVSKLNKDRKIIDHLTEVILKKTNFSKEIGEEANRVDIKSQTQITYLSYDKDELLVVLSTQLQDVKNKSLSVDKGKLSYKIDKAENKNNKILLTVAADAKLTPNLKREELMSDIKGKNISKLNDNMKKKYNISSIEFFIDHPIPFLRNWNPIFQRNIDLKITYR